MSCLRRGLASYSEPTIRLTDFSFVKEIWQFLFTTEIHYQCQSCKARVDNEKALFLSFTLFGHLNKVWNRCLFGLNRLFNTRNSIHFSGTIVSKTPSSLHANCNFYARGRAQFKASCTQMFLKHIAEFCRMLR